MKKLFDRPQSGLTLIEVMISIALLSMGMYAFTSVSSFLAKTQNIQLSKSTEDIVVLNLVTQLRSRSADLQKDYSGANPITKLNSLTTLPLAWDTRVNLQNVATCPSCKGRMAFIISPTPGFSDFYQMTVRVVPDVNVYSATTASSYSDYQFMVTTK